MYHFLKKTTYCTFILLLFAQAGIAQFSNIEVQNEKAVNSSELEFSPSFYKDGIVFISTNTEGMEKLVDDRIQKNAMSILRTRRGLDGKLTKPQPFDKNVTTRYHEGPVSFTAATDMMYFSRNVVENGKEKLAKDGELKMNIYSSVFSNNKWEEGKALSINSVDFDDCHPMISIDGDKLIFSSNREGGFGGMDLYMAYKTGDSWGEPINLGAEVNTAGNEIFPFLHADNTLYYASNGLPGAGGLDLFSAAYNGTGWSAPVNLAQPLNTAGDDFGLIVDLDKKNGYFSSNGRGGEGQDDIFSFHVKDGSFDVVADADERFDVVLKAMNTKSEMISNANVRVINLEKSNVIGKDDAGNSITLSNEGGQTVLGNLAEDAVLEGMTDANGAFECNLGPGNYLFTVSKDGYESKQGTRLVNQPSNLIEVILESTAPTSVRVNTMITNSKNNAPLGGTMLVLTDPASGTQQTVYADENGVVDVYLLPDTEYKMEAYRNGEQIGSSTLNSSNGFGAEMRLAMDVVTPTLPVGTTIELPNIYYNFNDATLRPDARQDLEMVLALAKQYPDLIFELGSHTDARGSDAYNNELSQARAESVVNFLVQNGISSDRLRAVGYGERQLRNSCADGVRCGERQHARNRRTEVKVVSGMDASTEIRQIEGTLGLGPSGRGVPFASNRTISGVSFANANAFYVVTGAFLEETNAENRLYDLLNRGYDGAQMTQFNGSPFYYVFVEKYSDFNDAIARKSSFVKDTQEEAFVKPVNQNVE